MSKEKFCPYCGGHLESGKCVCEYHIPPYKGHPLFQPSGSSLIEGTVKALNDHVESMIAIRTRASLPRNMATRMGIHPEAMAVISPTMANALLAYHLHWDSKSNPDRRTTPDILFDYIGRRTLIVKESPAYAITYYDSMDKVKEAYPDWWENVMVDSEEETDGFS